MNMISEPVTMIGLVKVTSGAMSSQHLLGLMRSWDGQMHSHIILNSVDMDILMQAQIINISFL